MRRLADSSYFKREWKRPQVYVGKIYGYENAVYWKQYTRRKYELSKTKLMIYNKLL